MAVLEPRLAILDETDSGLDIDALKVVADGVNSLRAPDRAFLVITHYQRLLNYIVPDVVHVLKDGRIVRSGDRELALTLEAQGYEWLESASRPRRGREVRPALATPAPVETVQAFDGFLASRMTEPSSFQLLRRRAMDRFAELGLPTPRREEWRFTNLSPLKDIELTPVGEPAPVPDEAAGRWPFSPARRLVFVDGRFARRLSSPSNCLPPVSRSPAWCTPSNVTRPGSRPISLTSRSSTATPSSPSTPPSTVMAPSSSSPPGTVLDQPLHMLYLSTSSALQRAVFPRTLIVAGEASQATVVETFVGVVGHSLTCPVTELVLGPGATLEHTRDPGRAPRDRSSRDAGGDPRPRRAARGPRLLPRRRPGQVRCQRRP